jgi:hypothetical protein
MAVITVTGCWRSVVACASAYQKTSAGKHYSEADYQVPHDPAYTEFIIIIYGAGFPERPSGVKCILNVDLS